MRDPQISCAMCGSANCAAWYAYCAAQSADRANPQIAPDIYTGFIPLFHFLPLFVLFHSYFSLVIHFHFTIIWFILFHSASFRFILSSFRFILSSFCIHFASFRLHFALFRFISYFSRTGSECPYSKAWKTYYLNNELKSEAIQWVMLKSVRARPRKLLRVRWIF